MGSDAGKPGEMTFGCGKAGAGLGVSMAVPLPRVSVTLSEPEPRMIPLLFAGGFITAVPVALS